MSLAHAASGPVARPCPTCGREWIIGGFVGGLAAVVTLGVLNFMLLWDRNRQEVWDKIAGTVVVDDTLQRVA